MFQKALFCLLVQQDSVHLEGKLAFSSSSFVSFMYVSPTLTRLSLSIFHADAQRSGGRNSSALNSEIVLRQMAAHRT